MLLQLGPHPDTVTHPGLWILWVECEANLSRWERASSSKPHYSRWRSSCQAGTICTDSTFALV